MTKKTDIVSELIGDWGPWQFRGVILIYLCKIPSAWFMACIIFTAPITKPGEFHCFQSEVQSVSTDSTQPPVIVQTDNNSMDFCTTFDRTYDDGEIKNSSLMEDKNNDTRHRPCTSFQFESNFESTVTRFSLVCSRSILIATSQFFHLFGVLTGGIMATKLMET